MDLNTISANQVVTQTNRAVELRAQAATKRGEKDPGDQYPDYNARIEREARTLDAQAMAHEARAKAFKIGMLWVDPDDVSWQMENAGLKSHFDAEHRTIYGPIETTPGLHDMPETGKKDAEAAAQASWNQGIGSDK